MDKYEYNLKLEEIDKLVDQGDYEEAANLADTIEWKRVRNIRTLCLISEIYEAAGRLKDSKRILERAYRKTTAGKNVLYRLVEVTTALQQYDEALEYYTEYVQAAPHDNNRYILKYRLYRGRGSSTEELISILEEYLGQEYTERWAYELAKLYQQAGQMQKCMAACDDLVLWFHSGKYVRKALELKKKYAALTPKQQQIYQECLQEEAEIQLDREEARAEEKAEEDTTVLSMESTDGEMMAEKIIAETEKEIAEEVTARKAEMEQQEAQGYQPTAAATKNLGAELVKKEENIEQRTESEAQSVQDRSTEREVQSAQELSVKTDVQHAQEKSPEAVVSSESDAQEITREPLDMEELQVDLARSMREIVSGVTRRQEIPEEDLPASVESRPRMTQKVEIPSTAIPTAGRLSIDDVLLSMGEKGKEYARKMADAQLAKSAKTNEPTGREAAETTKPAVELMQEEAVEPAVELTLADPTEPSAETTPTEPAEPAAETTPAELGAEMTPAEPTEPSAETTAAGTTEPAAETAPAEPTEPAAKPTPAETAEPSAETESAGAVEEEQNTEQPEEAAVKYTAEAKDELLRAAAVREAMEARKREAGQETQMAGETDETKEEAGKTIAEAAVEELTDVQREALQYTNNPEKLLRNKHALPTYSEGKQEVKEIPEVKVPEDLGATRQAVSREELRETVRRALIGANREAEAEANAASHDVEAEPEEKTASHNTEAETEANAASHDAEREPEGNAASHDAEAEAEVNEASHDAEAETEMKAASHNTEVETEENAVSHDAEAETEMNAAGDHVEEETAVKDDAAEEAASSDAPEDEAETDETSDSEAESENVQEKQQPRYTEEEYEDFLLIPEHLRGLFRGFTEIPDLEDQIANAIIQAQSKGDDRTSKSGNILIFGAAGSGKTTLAMNLAKAIAKDRGSQVVKMAKIYATDLNRKDIAATIAKIAGGTLIIEQAGDLENDTIEQLTTAMEFRTDGLIVILEDEQKYLHELLMSHPRFTMKFTSQIYVPEYTVEELAMFGQTYANEQDYIIGEEGLNALCDRISSLADQKAKDGEPVTIRDVIAMVSKAIDRANGFFRKVAMGKKRYDENDFIILLAKDFK